MPVRPTLQCWQEHGVTGTVAYCYLLIWIQGRTDALKSWWVVSYRPGFHRTQSILTSPSVCTRNDEIGFHRSPYASVYIYSWSLGSGEAQFLSLVKREQRVGLSIPRKRLLNQNQKIADPAAAWRVPWYADRNLTHSPSPSRFDSTGGTFGRCKLWGQMQVRGKMNQKGSMFSLVAKYSHLDFLGAHTLFAVVPICRTVYLKLIF